MMIIYTEEQIKSLDIKQHLPLMMRAIMHEFIEFSKGESVVPMPLHLCFPEARGECHVKAGYRISDDLFIIKVATGFYGNHAKGLPSGHGLMLVCCKKTGIIHSILCDAGYLTTLRTAITACIVTAITPWSNDRISVIGTGALARLILSLMHQQYPDTNIYLWGRNKDLLVQMQHEYPFAKSVTDLPSLVKKGGVIITTTASNQPLICRKDIDQQIHLIGLGADQKNKQEIDATIFSIADEIIVDSKEQAQHFGDSAVAIKNKLIDLTKINELGSILPSNVNPDARLIITNLTGIAPQDIGIAKYIIEALKA